MVQSPVRRNVQSGIPWWIWAMMMVVGCGVLMAVVVQLTPTNPMQHYNAALAAFEERDGETLAAEVKAFEVVPGYESEKKLLDALNWIAKSRPLKAIPLLEEIVDDPAVREHAMVQLGEAYLRAGQYQESVQALRDAVAEEASPLKAHSMLTRVLFDLGAPRESMTSATVLIEQGTELAHAYRTRGQAHFRMGNYEEAAKDLEASLEQDPGDTMNSVVAISLVRSLVHTEQYKEALDFIATADSGAPREAVRARAMLGMGQADEAFAVVDNVLAELSGQPEHFATFGRAILAAKPERAADAMEKIRTDLIYMNRSPELYSVLADLAEEAGDPAVAELYRQNQNKLQEMYDEYHARVQAIDGDITNGRTRAELGDLAAELREFDAASYWYTAAVRCDTSLAQEVDAKLQVLYTPRPELIPTPRAADAGLAPPGSRRPTESGGSFLDSDAIPGSLPPQGNDQETSPDDPAAATPAGDPDSASGNNESSDNPITPDPATNNDEPAEEKPASEEPGGNDSPRDGEPSDTPTADPA